MNAYGDPFVRWFAQYLVMERVTREQNHQLLYSTFLETLGNDALEAYVRQETFRNIKVSLFIGALVFLDHFSK